MEEPTLGLITADEFELHQPLGNASETPAVMDLTTLLSILREHDIKFHSPAGVLAHRQKKLREARSLVKATSLKYFITGVIVAVILAAASIGAWELGNLLAPLTSNSLFGQVSMVTALLLWVASFTFMWCAPVALAIGAYRGLRTLTRPSAAWASSPFAGDYEVPLAVQMLLYEITSKCGVLSLSIARLETKMPIFDLLLYVHYGDAELCVAAWEDAGFDAPLIT